MVIGIIFLALSQFLYIEGFIFGQFFLITGFMAVFISIAKSNLSLETKGLGLVVFGVGAATLFAFGMEKYVPNIKSDPFWEMFKELAKIMAAGAGAGLMVAQIHQDHITGSERKTDTVNDPSHSASDLRLHFLEISLRKMHKNQLRMNIVSTAVMLLLTIAIVAK